MADAAQWYETAYKAEGFSAQRRYPNEELLRFFGRHYFRLPHESRRTLSVLDVGCGAGANLWMIAREGFDAYGIDFSAASIALCKQMLKQWQAAATFEVADMTAMPYADARFDVITDVFSSNCLDEQGFALFLDEVRRLLRPCGRFFSCIPTKKSDAFRDPGPSPKLDSSTLDGIRRSSAPFVGNFYPFRFTDPDDYISALQARGLRVDYCETLGRTYRNRAEYFEFVAIEGVA